jgi:hypothetical protein
VGLGIDPFYISISYVLLTFEQLCKATQTIDKNYHICETGSQIDENQMLFR